MEKAGRGSVLMVQKCLEFGLPSPFWRSDSKLGVTVTFSAPEVTPEVTPEVMKLLKQLKSEMSRGDLQGAIGLRDAEHFRKSYINPALEIKAIEMTIPEKPTSNKQKYRISGVGKQLLEKLRDKGEA